MVEAGDHAIHGCDGLIARQGVDRQRDALLEVVVVVKKLSLQPGQVSIRSAARSLSRASSSLSCELLGWCAVNVYAQSKEFNNYFVNAQSTAMIRLHGTPPKRQRPRPQTDQHDRRADEDASDPHDRCGVGKVQGARRRSVGSRTHQTCQESRSGKLSVRRRIHRQRRTTRACVSPSSFK